MTSEFRIAVRRLLARPGYFAAASLTLAVGIGANTAVFSVLEAVILRKLPVVRPDELAVVGPGAMGVFSRADRPSPTVFSYAQYEALREDVGPLVSGLAAAPTFPTTVYTGQRGDDPAALRRASCMLVSGSYFPLLGVRPAWGRLLGPADDGPPGASRVVVASHAFWTSRLGSDPAAVGSTIRLHGEPYSLIGVTEPTFSGHMAGPSVDLWTPLSMQAEVTRSESRLHSSPPVETFWLNILLRTKPDSSRGMLQEAVNLSLKRRFADWAGAGISDSQRQHLDSFRVELTSMARGISRIRSRGRQPLILLWCATGLVLFVACANLGNLMLVRAAESRREFGVRRALGASRRALLKPLLSESLVLAATGTTLGCALASLAVPWIRAQAASRLGGGPIDARIAVAELGVAAAAGALAVLLFGLAPALWTARRTSWDCLRGSAPWRMGRRLRIRGRDVLVASQFALALSLLTASGLILKTLAELRGIDLGLDAEAAVGIQLDPQGGGFSPESQPAMRRRILDQVAALPGVDSAAFTGSLPLRGNFGMRTISVSGYVPREEDEMNVIHVWASPGYFRALGVRVLQGRPPGRGDPGAVAVNQSFAARYFGDSEALGGLIDNTKRIVAVVADVRHVNLRDPPPPIIYENSGGREAFVRTLLARGIGETGALAARLRETVKDLVPAMPVADGFDTIELHREQAIALEKAVAGLVSAFALCALLLSGMGLFGVSSYVVRSRTAEFGLRMALGANRTRIQSMILLRGALVMGAGALVGVGGALVAGRLFAGLLYEVQPLDPTVVFLALAALTVCAFIAVAVPAVRAARIAPAAALRFE